MVPSSLLNREFLQLCTSCIFSVLGRCACYKIVTTTYLSESLSMCILTLCMQHCSVRQEVSSRPKCSHTPIPYCDSRVWVVGSALCIAGVSNLLFAVGNPMFSRNDLEYCTPARQSVLHTLVAPHSVTVSDKKCELSAGDFSVSPQYNFSEKTKAMLDLHKTHSCPHTWSVS